MDIKQQIKEYLNKKNTTLTNVVNIINSFKSKEEQTTVQNVNNKLTRGTIKYSEVLEIAQILGYDIIWQEQKPNEVNLSTFNIEYIPPSNYPVQSGVNYDKPKENPRNVEIDQLVQKFFSIVIDELNKNSYIFPNKQEFESNLVIAKMNLYSFPIQSFIYMHSEFLNNSLYRINSMTDYISTITYLRNIYIRGGIEILNESSKRDLITLLKFFIKEKD
jgi:hypothetical protein